jgi:hypothetical protein
MEDPVIITFGTPTHGWLPVEFKAGSLSLDFGASAVLNEPLEELYNSIKRLLEHKTGEVTWWLEPHTYFFYFERTGAKDFRLTVTEAVHLDKEKKQLMVLNGSYKELIAPMRRALLAFCDLDYEKRHWPVSFNKADIENLPKGL